MIRRFFLCAYVLCACWVLPSLAGAGKEQAVASLDEVVVTSSRVEENKREVTSNITVVGEEEITQSAARDLGELLLEENIGHFQNYPGTLTPVGLRGFQTETHGNDLEGKVLILLNGRRAGTRNVAKIMTENIRGVEIIRSPASVQYGSAAIGGVINVITKQGEGKPSGFVLGKLGSYGFEEEAAGMSGQVGQFDFSGAIRRSTQDDYDTADGDDYGNTGYDEKLSGSLNLGYEFLPRTRIGVIYTGFDADEVGSPSHISQNDRDDYNDKSHESGSVQQRVGDEHSQEKHKRADGDHHQKGNQDRCQEGDQKTGPRPGKALGHCLPPGGWMHGLCAG